MKLHFRRANENDLDLYFNWANEDVVRKNSFHSEPVAFSDHVNWFRQKLADERAFLYLFLDENNIPVGQVRIERKKEETVIGISVDKAFRGQSLSSCLLVMACDDHLKKHPGETITAYIKNDNSSSIRSFLKAGFSLHSELLVHNQKSSKFIKFTPSLHE